MNELDILREYIPAARAKRSRSDRLSLSLGRRDVARLRRLAEQLGVADLAVVARALILRAADELDVRRCHVCGCTDMEACVDGCEWVAVDLCSACVPTKPKKRSRGARS